MKLALTLEADSVNVQALNMGRIVVDVDGVNLSELINKVSENGYLLRVVDKSDQHATSTPPPLTTLTCIRCSTAHITETDNAWLYSLSHQTNDDGESEWIHFTGSGYLLRTDAWSSGSGHREYGRYLLHQYPTRCDGTECSTATNRNAYPAID